jgi:hypothetical protein
MEYLRSALSCFGLGGEVGTTGPRSKKEEMGCGRCQSHGARLADTERNIDKLWSAAHTLRNRLDQCDTDLEMILHWFNRVTYSPTYVTEEPQTVLTSFFPIFSPTLLLLSCFIFILTVLRGAGASRKRLRHAHTFSL